MATIDRSLHEPQGLITADGPAGVIGEILDVLAIGLPALVVVAGQDVQHGPPLDLGQSLKQLRSPLGDELMSHDLPLPTYPRPIVARPQGTRMMTEHGDADVDVQCPMSARGTTAMPSRRR